MPDPRFFEDLGPISLSDLAHLTGAELAPGVDGGRAVGPKGKRGHARERRIAQQLRNGNIVPAGTLTLGCVARVGEPTRDLDKLERAAEVKERITRA